MEIRKGKVPMRPTTIQQLWAQLDARYSRLLELRDQPEHHDDFMSLKGECHGLAVAIACIWALTIEEVSAEAHKRHVNPPKPLNPLMGQL